MGFRSFSTGSNAVWEKLLSVLLTANIVMMGWLWTNIARLADRLDHHIADRAIHQSLDERELVKRSEFELAMDSAGAGDRQLAVRLDRLEDKIDRLVERELNDES